MNRPQLAAVAAETGSPNLIAAESEGTDFWGEDGFTLGDFVDLINPLHHIPIIGTLYRHLTGDEISPAARIAGGALFAGPVGFATALFSQVMEETTGKDPGAHAIALLTGEASEGTPDPPPGPATAAAAISPDKLRDMPLQPLTLAVAKTTGDGEVRVPGRRSNLPQLSPQAFDALLRGTGAQATSSSHPLPASAAPAGAIAGLPSARPIPMSPANAYAATPANAEHYRTALELHRLLSAHFGGGKPDPEERMESPAGS